MKANYGITKSTDINWTDVDDVINQNRKQLNHLKNNRNKSIDDGFKFEENKAIIDKERPRSKSPVLYSKPLLINNNFDSNNNQINNIPSYSQNSLTPNPYSKSPKLYAMNSNNSNNLNNFSTVDKIDPITSINYNPINSPTYEKKRNNNLGDDITNTYEMLSNKYKDAEYFEKQKDQKEYETKMKSSNEVDFLKKYNYDANIKYPDHNNGNINSDDYSKYYTGIEEPRINKSEVVQLSPNIPNPSSQVNSLYSYSNYETTAPQINTAKFNEKPTDRYANNENFESKSLVFANESTLSKEIRHQLDYNKDILNKAKVNSENIKIVDQHNQHIPSNTGKILTVNQNHFHTNNTNTPFIHNVPGPINRTDRTGHMRKKSSDSIPTIDMDKNMNLNYANEYSPRSESPTSNNHHPNQNQPPISERQFALELGIENPSRNYNYNHNHNIADNKLQRNYDYSHNPTNIPISHPTHIPSNKHNHSDFNVKDNSVIVQTSIIDIPGMTKDIINKSSRSQAAISSSQDYIEYEEQRNNPHNHHNVMNSPGTNKYLNENNLNEIQEEKNHTYESTLTLTEEKLKIKEDKIENVKMVMKINSDLEKRNNELENKNNQQRDEISFLREKNTGLESFKNEVDDKMEKIIKEFDENDKSANEREQKLLKQLSLLKLERDDKDLKISDLEAKEKLRAREFDHLNKKLKDFEYILEDNANENTDVIKEMKNECETLKEVIKIRDNQWDIIIFFLNKVRSLYNKDKIVNNANDEEFLSIKNLSSGKLQERLIELENYLTNNQNNRRYLENEDGDDSGNNPNNMQIYEKLQPLNEKINYLADENRILRLQIEQIHNNNDTNSRFRKRTEGNGNHVSSPITPIDNNRISVLSDDNSLKNTMGISGGENVFTYNYQDRNRIFGKERDRQEGGNPRGGKGDSRENREERDIKNERERENPRDYIKIRPILSVKDGNSKIHNNSGSISNTSKENIKKNHSTNETANSGLSDNIKLLEKRVKELEKDIDNNKSLKEKSVLKDSVLKKNPKKIKNYLPNSTNY